MDFQSSKSDWMCFDIRASNLRSNKKKYFSLPDSGRSKSFYTIKRGKPIRYVLHLGDSSFFVSRKQYDLQPWDTATLLFYISASICACVCVCVTDYNGTYFSAVSTHSITPIIIVWFVTICTSDFERLFNYYERHNQHKSSAIKTKWSCQTIRRPNMMQSEEVAHRLCAKMSDSIDIAAPMSAQFKQQPNYRLVSNIIRDRNVVI